MQPKLIASLILNAIYLTYGGSLRAYAATDSMTISYDPPPKGIERVLGTGWTIYLSGRIEADTASKFESFIGKNNVPAWSSVYLDSPGGSLYGGMELAMVIRKHQFTTNVGIKNPKGIRNSPLAGKCYSSCTYAFLGGNFRYINSGSRYGVHRFYTKSPNDLDMDAAQIASAEIVGFIRKMGVDTDFFKISTLAGANDIYEPPAAVLEKLRIVNNGFGKTTWTLESVAGILYLKGERETVFGINKILFGCLSKSEIFLHAIFDPQGRQNESKNWVAHSLVIDDEPEPIAAHNSRIENDWYNSIYILNASYYNRISAAKKIGVIAQYAYGAPTFHGIYSMPFVDGIEKLGGILNSCK